MVVETWLDSTVSDTDLYVNGYTCNYYRKDRKGKGGGILLTFNEDVSCIRRTDLEIYDETDCVCNEFMVCVIELSNGTNMVVILFYRSPKVGY